MKLLAYLKYFGATLVVALPVVLHAQSPGSLDPSYKLIATDTPALSVVAQTVAPGDTRALVGGGFTALLSGNGTSIQPLARFNADGSLDTVFTTNLGGFPLVNVTALALQPDGKKILVAGSDTSKGLVLRYNADGTPDTSFQVTTDDSVESFAFPSDGSILISGYFNTVNGTGNQRGLAKLSATGVLDPQFQAFSNSLLTIVEVHRIALLPSGDLVAATRVSEGSATYLIELSGTDGSRPSSGIFSLVADGTIYALAVDSAGQVLIGGSFDGIDNHPRAGHIARFTTAGLLDGNFVGNPDLPGLTINALVVDASGKVIVGGNTDGDHAIYRLTGDTGAKDSAFSFPLGALNSLSSLALQSDGLLLAAGQFQNGQQAPSVIRVITGSAVTPPAGGSNIIVPGTANPYLAGLPNGTTASGGDDSAPADSPVLVPGLTLTPNKPLNFTVAGSVSTDAAVSPTEGPDGGFFFAHNPENSFSKLVAPINSLVGVFLTDAAPDPTTVNNAVRDFSDTAATNGGVDYPGYQPRLGEPFFIGDGKNYAQYVQNVFPPAGATRLFLGVLDGNDYFNNLGQFTVGATQSGDIDTTNIRLGQTVSTPTDSNGASALIGDQITYTFHVKNEGSRAFGNVVVADVLPSVCELVSASDGGTFQNGVVTWNLGTLTPTGTGPSKDLTLVVKTFATGDAGANVSAAQIGQVINNTNYYITGYGLPLAVPGLDLQNPTILQAPVSVAIRSNSTAVAPGDQLTYTIDLKNTTASKVKKPTFSLALPAGVKFVEAMYVDDSGTPIPLVTPDGGVTFTSAAGNFALDGGQTAIFKVGNLKHGASAHLVLTVQVPFDVLPTASINFGSAQLVTKTTDSDGQDTYGVAVPDNKLSGVDPQKVPQVSLLKFVPDPVTILKAIDIESVSEPTIGAIFEALFPGLKDGKSLDKLKKKVNPDVIDTTAEDGSDAQAVTAGTGARITFALVYRNAGGGKLTNSVLQDRVPQGTTLVADSVTFNGEAAPSGFLTTQDNDRTLLFNLKKIAATKPGKPSFGIVTYTVQMIDPGAGGVAAGGVIQSTGGALNSASLFHTTFAFPGEIDISVLGPEHLSLGLLSYNQSPSSNPAAQPGHTNQVIYDIPYKNDGGQATTGVLVFDALPTGATNAVGTIVSGPSGTVEPFANGQIVFHLGALPRKAAGTLRVVATLGADALKATLAPTNRVGWVESSRVNANVAGRPVRRVHGRPVTRTLIDEIEASITNQGTFGGPGIPKLFVSVMAPLAVKEGDTYDYLIAVSNPTDSPIPGGVALTVYLPDNAEFVSGNQGNIAGSYMDHGFKAVTFPNVDAAGNTSLIAGHHSQINRVTVRAPKGSANQVFKCADVYTLSTDAVVLGSGQLLTPIPQAHSGEVATYVYPADEPFANVRSQIVSAALAEQGVEVAAFAGSPTFQAKVQAIDPAAVSVRTGGADGVQFNNGTMVIPLGANNVLAIGSSKGLLVRSSDLAALGSAGGSTLISQDGGGLVAQGGGNLIRLSNLVAQGGGNLVAQGGGNLVGPEGRDFATVLSGLVAQGGGNLIAQGGGNLVAQGGGNLITQDGGGLVAQGGGNLVGHLISNTDGSILPTLASSLISQDGGGLVAQGGGNLVAQGGGNLVAQGGGNLVAQGGGNLVAQGGGNFIAAGGGNALGTDSVLRGSSDTSAALLITSNGLVAQGGGNLVAQGGGNLVAQGGGN